MIDNSTPLVLLVAIVAVIILMCYLNFSQVQTNNNDTNEIVSEQDLLKHTGMYTLSNDVNKVLYAQLNIFVLLSVQQTKGVNLQSEIEATRYQLQDQDTLNRITLYYRNLTGRHDAEEYISSLKEIFDKVEKQITKGQKVKFSSQEQQDFLRHDIQTDGATLFPSIQLMADHFEQGNIKMGIASFKSISHKFTPVVSCSE